MIFYLSTAGAAATSDKKQLNEAADIISSFILNKHPVIVKNEQENNILKTLKCVYSEITVPSAKKIRTLGPSGFFKHFITGTFRSFVTETNLIAEPFLGYDEEDQLLKARFDSCITGKPPAEVAEGRSGGYGSDKSAIGFALLGLKVVGALAAFLAWDLFNM